jgi:hypothetical protein
LYSKKKCKQDYNTNKLATIDDLHDYVAGTGEVFTYNVETSEGVVQWHEEHFSYDSPVDYICEYRVIN